MIKLVRIITFLIFSVMVAIPVIADIDSLSPTNPSIPGFISDIPNDPLITKPGIPGLSQPNISHSDLLDFANQLAVAAFTYDYLHYKAEFQTLSNYFTLEGWKQFYNSLLRSNNLQVVIDKKFGVTAVVTYPPVILQQGLRDGLYSWRVQTYILVTYKDAKQYLQQPLIVTILFSTVSSDKGTKGIRAIQFVTQ